jgi:N-acetylmuramic acid 6-phosphate etherase
MSEHDTSEDPLNLPFALDSLSADDLVCRMNAEDAKLANVVAAQTAPIARAIEAIAARLRHGGRLLYVGAGTSGRLGVLDAAGCPSTFGTEPSQVVGIVAGGLDAMARPVADAEDSASDGARIMDDLRVGPRDAVVGVTASGWTPYVVGALTFARAKGAWVGVVCCNSEHAFNDLTDGLIVLDVGPEILVGSTRLKAGTATKMVLNMLSTGALVRSGKTFNNQMVDLQPLNNKLRERGSHIVVALTGLPEQEAQTLLDRCAGEIKTAIIAHTQNLSPAEARLWLQAADGDLRSALETSTSPARTARQAPTTTAPGSRNPADLVLGVDAGGSKTVALLQSATSAAEPPVGRGLAGPGNIAVDLRRALTALEAAIDLARADAGCREGPFASVCLAVAGSGTEEGRLTLERWANRRLLAEKVLVVHDAHPVLACVAPEGPGIALIAGTGSIAFARNERGETARAGGWGWLACEKGSAYGIALAALQAIAAAADDCGPATRLTSEFFQLFRVNDVRSVFGTLYQSGANVTHVARLARVVSVVAEAGDEVALQILDGAAARLASIALVVARRLGLKNGTFPLGLAGSVLLHSEIVRRLLQSHLAQRNLATARTVLVEDPALGSLHLARLALRASSTLGA